MKMKNTVLAGLFAVAAVVPVVAQEAHVTPDTTGTVVVAGQVKPKGAPVLKVGTEEDGVVGAGKETGLEELPQHEITGDNSKVKKEDGIFTRAWNSTSGAAVATAGAVAVFAKYLVIAEDHSWVITKEEKTDWVLTSVLYFRRAASVLLAAKIAQAAYGYFAAEDENEDDQD